MSSGSCSEFALHVCRCFLIHSSLVHLPFGALEITSAKILGLHPEKGKKRDRKESWLADNEGVGADEKTKQ